MKANQGSGRRLLLVAFVLMRLLDFPSRIHAVIPPGISASLPTKHNPPNPFLKLQAASSGLAGPCLKWMGAGNGLFSHRFISQWAMKEMLFSWCTTKKKRSSPKRLGCGELCKAVSYITWGLKTPYNAVCCGIPTYYFNYLLIKVINGTNSNNTEKLSSQEGPLC